VDGLLGHPPQPVWSAVDLIRLKKLQHVAISIEYRNETDTQTDRQTHRQAELLYQYRTSVCSCAIKTDKCGYLLHVSLGRSCNVRSVTARSVAKKNIFWHLERKFLEYSFLTNGVPQERKFQGVKVLGTFTPEEWKFHRGESSKERMFHGTKVPREQVLWGCWKCGTVKIAGGGKCRSGYIGRASVWKNVIHRHCYTLVIGLACPIMYFRVWLLSRTP